MPVLSQWYRVSVRHPDTGKPVTKSFSVRKYGLENCKRYGEEWKAAIKDGKEYKPPEPDVNETYGTMPLTGFAAPPPIESSVERVAKELFPLKEFTFARDPDPALNACSFALIGSSKSGKTTFLKHLLHAHFKDDIKVFMTQSPQADIYESLKNDVIFCPDFIPEMIKECYTINKECKNHYPFCTIIDDVADMRAKNHPQMTKLLCVYRNAAQSAIISGQSPQLLNPSGRANVNYVCLFYQNTDGRCEDTVKAFLRSYFPRSLKMEEKIELYKMLTEDHCFLFVDNLNNTITRCKLKPSQIME